MAQTTVETDGFALLSQPSSGTPYGQFRLAGGNYNISVTSTGSGTAQLAKVEADGSTANVGAALAGVSPGTNTVLNLSPGMYQVTIAVATCTVGCSRIHNN
jgi:hypothetical protein